MTSADAAAALDADQVERYRALVGLEVYAPVADRLVRTRPLDALDVAIEGGRSMRAQGTPRVGGYVAQIAEGTRPAPLALRPPPPPPEPAPDGPTGTPFTAERRRSLAAQIEAERLATLADARADARPAQPR